MSAPFLEQLAQAADVAERACQPPSPSSAQGASACIVPRLAVVTNARGG
jgi:hypothetical protein